MENLDVIREKFARLTPLFFALFGISIGIQLLKLASIFNSNFIGNDGVDFIAGFYGVPPLVFLLLVGLQLNRYKNREMSAYLRKSMKLYKVFWILYFSTQAFITTFGLLQMISFF